MLSDERADELAKPFAGMGGVEDYRGFARAIERESTTPLLEQIKRFGDAAEMATAMLDKYQAQIKEDEALMQQALNALEESRDDVVSSLNNLEHGKGYPSYDRRIQRVTEQLSKHDAVIEAMRQRLEAKK